MWQTVRSWFRTSRKAAKPLRRARPCLEALETRWCPSATATLADQGHTLVIKGDVNANVISIVQDDASDKITVICDETSSHYASSQITKIRALLKGGEDKLIYDLASDTKYGKVLRFDLGTGADQVDVHFAFAGPALDPVTVFSDFDFKISGRGGADHVVAYFGRTISSNLTFEAILGAGNDVATVSVLEELQAFSHLRFLLDGNAGDDTIYMVAGGMTGSQFDVNVGILSTLDVTMRGQAGRDILASYYDGILSGGVSVHQLGGLGADSIGNIGKLLAGGNGTFDGAAFGGNGSDQMTFNAIDETNGAATLIALCDGGLGTDTGAITGPVTSVNIP